MNKEYILKMLAILEHDKIISAINKKGYLVTSKKLNNHAEYKNNIDSLLRDNYNTISNEVAKLSDKAIMFLESPKVLTHLRENDIILYSIIKIDINYIINKIFKGFKYEIIEDKVELSKNFNSSHDAQKYVASLADKRDSIQSLFKQFNLKYILVFNISAESFFDQVVIDTSSNGSIGVYAIQHCIDEELLDFEDDTLVVGVKATNNWKLKRTAILESKKFILNNAYPNFSNIKVKLCAPDGSFLDELGENLISIGYSITSSYNKEDNKIVNKTETIAKKVNSEYTTVTSAKETDETKYTSYIEELDKVFDSYLIYKLSSKVYIDDNLKKIILEHTIDEKNNIKSIVKQEFDEFKNKLDTGKEPLSEKLNIIKNKIDELYREMIPF